MVVLWSRRLLNELEVRIWNRSLGANEERRGKDRQRGREGERERETDREEGVSTDRQRLQKRSDALGACGLGKGDAHRPQREKSTRRPDQISSRLGSKQGRRSVNDAMCGPAQRCPGCLDQRLLSKQLLSYR